MYILTRCDASKITANMCVKEKSGGKNPLRKMEIFEPPASVVTGASTEIDMSSKIELCPNDSVAGTDGAHLVCVFSRIA